MLLLLVALALDTAKYIIPNWLVLTVAGLYPVFVLLSPEKPDWLIALAVGAGMFVAGFAIYAFKMMGGGDVKLLAALSLWTGKTSTLEFVTITAVYGGLLALALIVGRKFVPWLYTKMPEGSKIPRVLTIGEPLPYGIAIAFAFITLMITGNIKGIPPLI